MAPGGLWFCKVAWREHYDRGVTPSSLQVWVESPGPTMRLHGEGGGGGHLAEEEGFVGLDVIDRGLWSLGLGVRTK